VIVYPKDYRRDGFFMMNGGNVPVDACTPRYCLEDGIGKTEGKE
jgi:hypothetical protein